MKSSKGNFNQQPMFDVMKPSLSHNSFRQKTNMTLTDVSFSSHLAPDEPNRRAADDSELSIFDAQKYFNENNDHIISNGGNRVSLVKECYSDFPGIPRLSSASSSVDGFGRIFRVRSFHSYATPTASSEASWNSHTGLLSNPPGAVSVTLREPTTERKTGCSSSRWLLLRRKCACLGKKSVRVKERPSEPIAPTNLKLHDSKSKELLNSKMQVDIAAGKAGSTATTDSDLLKVVTDPSRYHEHKLKEMNAQRRFSSSEAEKDFQLDEDARRVSLSVLPSRSPFVDGNTAGFNFPILNPPLTFSSSPPMKMVLNGSASPPRDSLEVFQPLGDHVSRKSRENNEHRSTQLRVRPTGLPPRDHRAFAFPASPKSRLNTAMVDDEAASDASSDLFEIESFSTQSTSYPGYNNRHRDSLDEARPRFSTSTGLYNCLDDQPMTPTSTAYDTTECGYEPSEASIAWSVTTAEGTQFDRASLTNYSISASDVEEFTKMQLKLHHELEKNSHESSGGNKKRGSGLLSCRCEKAVSVGPNPVKWVPEMGPGLGQGNRKGPSPPAATSLTRHVSSRPPTAQKPPLASSRSSRLSLTFAA